MKCTMCEKEFIAKRSSAKFCSTKCRKLAFQKVSVLSVPIVSVPEKETQDFEKKEKERYLKRFKNLNHDDITCALYISKMCGISINEALDLQI
jgi:hypothetical protein